MTRIRFEDLPSTNTPRNAENLNKLNNVVISPTEPTTGEEVWIQASKNLFDTKLLVQGGWDASYRQDRVSWGMKVKAGVIYTITNYSQKTISIFETENLTQSNTENSVLGEHGKITGTGNMTLTTLSDGYLRLLFNNSGDTNISVSDILPSYIQIEQGDTSTSYEPYIEKKIFVKNDNDVYDEFYKQREIAIVDISLETGAGKANFPQGFTPENSIIIGHMDKNKWGMPFGNVKEVETIINGDERNLVAVGTGNFSGGVAKTSVVLMKLY